MREYSLPIIVVALTEAAAIKLMSEPCCTWYATTISATWLAKGLCWVTTALIAGGVAAAFIGAGVAYHRWAVKMGWESVEEQGRKIL